MYNNSNVDSLMLGIFAVVILVYVVIVLICSVPTIIGRWIAYKKAGKGGWEAIIPIYTDVVSCQISGVNPLWVLIVYVLAIASGMVKFVGPILYFVALIYFKIILNISIAKSYGKENVFAIGLIFLPIVFWPLLAGKSTKYVGATPANDVVMEFITSRTGNNGASSTNNQPSNNVSSESANYQQPQPVEPQSSQQVQSNPISSEQQTNPEQSTSKFCTTCGAKLIDGQKFCTSCGAEATKQV